VASGDAHRESLQPEALFAFLERHPENGPEYVTATAEMIQRRYPEQAAEVLPRLREIWKAKMKKKYG
jgi:hypothetical protein